MIKGLILQGGIIVLNVYVPNNRTSKYKAQLWKYKDKIKEKIIMGDDSTLLSIWKRQSK